MSKRKFRVWKGDNQNGGLNNYSIDVEKGMVVLDVIHAIQKLHDSALAARWNCKAGKCGSCSVEINGKPKLGCMTRLNEYSENETITIRPLKTFPIIKDLVTDVSWNYEQNKKIKPFKPRKRDKDGNHRFMQRDIDRIQEFRKCIECYLCQNVCHVLRDNNKKEKFTGPRFMLRLASLEMHPLDTEDRIKDIKEEHGSGMCNITRCCTDVCPEHIQITDNAIIPLKERVVDRYYDPLLILYNKIFKKQ